MCKAAISKALLVSGFVLMMHLLLAEGEETMVQLIAASLETAAMCLNKMRMKISAIGMNAPI